MAAFTDALRGYAFEILKRDNFKCRYCGMDGSKSFDTWLTLSWDHLLPKGHLNRDNPAFIVAACHFCNTADNQYFRYARERGLKFDGMTPEELVTQRLPYVMKTRASYREFWENNVFGDEFNEQTGDMDNAPSTRGLSGILSQDVGVEDYKIYLEEKYLQSSNGS
jgi:hypothetical protein